MDRAKPYDIPKREVWEAYKRVRANQGAAGVDGQMISDFEGDLKTTSINFGIVCRLAATFRHRCGGSTYRRAMAGCARWGSRRLLIASPRWWSNGISNR